MLGLKHNNVRDLSKYANENSRTSHTLFMQNQKIMYFNHAKPENHVL